MKYSEKQAAFDPKKIIGPAAGATIFGLSGYAGAEKGKELPSTLVSAATGAVIGMGTQAWVKRWKESGKALKSFASEHGEGIDPVIQKSKDVMETLKKQEAKIKSHVATKSKFKYKEALKMTKEKKAAFLDILTGKKVKQLDILGKRYEKAFKWHASKIDKAKKDLNILEGFSSLSKADKAGKKMLDIEYKKGIEQLKRVGVFGGAAVGASMGIGAVLGRNKKEVTKLARASKSEATIYTGVGAGVGAGAGLLAGEGYGEIHKRITVDPLEKSEIYKNLPEKLKKAVKASRIEHAAKISKNVRRFGAIAGGALGAGAAANYFIRKNI